MIEHHTWKECRLCGEKLDNELYEHLTIFHNYEGSINDSEYFYISTISAKPRQKRSPS